MIIRTATAADHDAIWSILEPVIRAGDTYALPRDWSREQALSYWFADGHHTFVAEDDGQILGTYYLKANQKGGGSHVANCGYMTAAQATGKGVARAMCQHSLEVAKDMSFAAMQFNFVVSTNSRAVALWHGLGFQTLTRLPDAFDHPTEGLVDALVMFRKL
ncbi:GNAT family N-acetyltransferase [Asticcacaulis machinosus]|uniref:GNAT family N-acetyltransferase n=1 Tax=Asticcacaulis machinosus TaxID=2984211 RepID=A0ABT5HN38_9CAUL|nr:GNAT family N-acetyltransferase [Asticcacaulis machinosus]MDC7677577.1 GNAT family N-acetyltransferase [Asticcacaulis machinosus]